MRVKIPVKHLENTIFNLIIDYIHPVQYYIVKPTLLASFVERM